MVSLRIRYTDRLKPCAYLASALPLLWPSFDRKRLDADRSLQGNSFLCKDHSKRSKQGKPIVVTVPLPWSRLRSVVHSVGIYLRTVYQITSMTWFLIFALGISNAPPPSEGPSLGARELRTFCAKVWTTRRSYRSPSSSARYPRRWLIRLAEFRGPRTSWRIPGWVLCPT